MLDKLFSKKSLYIISFFISFVATIYSFFELNKYVDVFSDNEILNISSWFTVFSLFFIETIKFLFDFLGEKIEEKIKEKEVIKEYEENA